MAQFLAKLYKYKRLYTFIVDQHKKVINMDESNTIDTYASDVVLEERNDYKSNVFSRLRNSKSMRNTIITLACIGTLNNLGGKFIDGYFSSNKNPKQETNYNMNQASMFDLSSKSNAPVKGKGTDYEYAFDHLGFKAFPKSFTAVPNMVVTDINHDNRYEIVFVDKDGFTIYGNDMSQGP